MEAKAKYDFGATAEDELSFRRGDILKILGSRGEWFNAEMHGQVGVVPQNYIDFQCPSWFHEKATRGSAEEALMSRGLGAFLIRGSHTAPGSLSMSVRHESDVQHFRVMTDSKGNYFLWSDKRTSVNKLVDLYKITSISKQREIYLNDGSRDDKSQSTTQQLKRGSLPEERSYGNQYSAPTQRRASDQPHSQTSKRGLEERAHTIGAVGRSSPLSFHPTPRRTGCETMPLPQTTTLQVKALYDFTAEEGDELGFSAGDIIEVVDHSDVSWWKGRARGKSGLFPANYTSPL